jgi:RNA polymerase sigma factor (sigma-70 family)
MLKPAGNIISDSDFEEFLNKLRNNDERSWAQLNFVLKRIVFKWLNRKHIYTNDAVEIYNNVVTVFFEKFAGLKFDSFHGLKSYVFSIADNKLKEFFREDARRHRNDTIDKISEHKYVHMMAESEYDDFHEKITRAEKLFDKLTKNERDVMMKVYKEGYSLKEAAVKMKLSEGNARVIKHRALEKLKQWYFKKTETEY